MACVPNAQVGDYVIVHAGIAISRLSESEAEKTLHEFATIADAVDGDASEPGDTAMKFVDEFRDPVLASQLVLQIRSIATRRWCVMEVCGGQTHALLRYGIDAELIV